MTRMGPKPGTVYNLPPHDIITEGGAVGVLLSNRPGRVWIDRADFDRIVKAHGNRSWSWIEATRYVSLKVDQKRSVSIARLVVGNDDRFIRYADGDRLNLRRENLSTEKPVRPGARVKRGTPKQGASRASSAKVRPPGRSPSERQSTTSSAPSVSILQIQKCRTEAMGPHLPAKVAPPKRSTQVIGTFKRPSKQLI